MTEVLSNLNETAQEMLSSFAANIPFLILGIILFLTYLFISRLVQKLIIKRLKNKIDDQLLLGFFSDIISITNVIIAILLFLYAIGRTGVITSILGAAGVSAFVIGFAFKDIGENFLAGVIMAFNRPFRLGDTIKTNNIEGVITELNLRDTMIKTFDGKDVSIPNGFIIKNPLHNYTIDGFLRHTVTFSINNPEKSQIAMDIIKDTVTKIPGVLTEVKPVQVYIPNLNKNAIDISVNYWINTIDPTYSSFEIKSGVFRNCVIALNKADLSLDYDVIDVRNFENQSFKLSNNSKPENLS